MIVLLVVAMFGLNGCFKISETVNFNKDGSGDYTLSIDMGSMIAMLQNLDLNEMMGGEGSDEDASLPSDAFQKRDTVINVFDMMSARSEKVERPEFWKKANIFVKVDGDNGVFLADVKFPFKDTDEISFFYNNIGELAGNNEEIAGMLGGGMSTNTISDLFSFKKRTFTRKANSMDMDDLGGLDEEMQSQMEMVKMFMSGATYTTIYNFPKKVKSASNKDAKISQDKKTVTTEVSFLDILDGKNDISNVIKLKLF